MPSKDDPQKMDDADHQKYFDRANSLLYVR
jgi:hypothetical protein